MFHSINVSLSVFLSGLRSHDVPPQVPIILLHVGLSSRNVPFHVSMAVFQVGSSSQVLTIEVLVGRKVLSQFLIFYLRSCSLKGNCFLKTKTTYLVCGLDFAARNTVENR